MKEGKACMHSSSVICKEVRERRAPSSSSSESSVLALSSHVAVRDASRSCDVRPRDAPLPGRKNSSVYGSSSEFGAVPPDAERFWRGSSSAGGVRQAAVANPCHGIQKSASGAGKTPCKVLRRQLLTWAQQLGR